MATRPPPAPAATLLKALSSPPFAVMRVAGPVMSCLALSTILPPAPAPQMHGDPQSPRPPSAMTPPAMTTRAFAPFRDAAPPAAAGDPPAGDGGARVRPVERGGPAAVRADDAACRRAAAARAEVRRVRDRVVGQVRVTDRSEEYTSELQS